MTRILVILTAVFVSLAFQGAAPVGRPEITGIAHVRIYVSDVGKSWRFYGDILALPTEGGGCDTTRPCLPVNPRQQIEFEHLPSSAPKNWLAEVAFTTDDVAQMRRYLLAHGVTASAVSKDPNGAQHFESRDPERNPIAFVQPPPTTAAVEASTEQVGKRLFHAGFVVRDAALQDHFYREILGFRMYWHGGFQDTGTDWEEIQVPNGTDWIEYMLNISPNADHQELGIQNHFSLGVAGIQPAFQLLLGHGLKTDDKPEIGRDGKWSFDIYDPDGTRVEFMEFTPAQQPCCHPYQSIHPVP
jgi:catechol 2,3-dioxygenase-like lactoylglutathione lyase family enzyme